MTPSADWLPHLAHWGAFSARWDGQALQVRPHPNDPDPNALIDNLPAAVQHPARVMQPMVRRGWLERGPGPDWMRGRDEFIPLSWDGALELAARELKRVNDQHGPESIFGGSYGWSSAGRFHHAQSQVHRFLNTTFGGYVRSVNTYSAGSSMVLMPHILGGMEEVARRNVTWTQIVEHTEVVLAFGGMAVRNTQVASGGVSQHVERPSMAAAAQRGCRFINISPLKDDLPPEAQAEWCPVKPGTDTALMLALVHTLVTEGLHDQAFIDRYCQGWSDFLPYLLGQRDGQPKDAAWASPLCGWSAEAIVHLARSLPGRRVLVVVAHSLQRARHGEQPVWMAAVLASVLGQIGLPGAGYNYALGSLAHYGHRYNTVGVTALPQGRNAVKAFIPVARIADMLLHPGEPFDYDGTRHTYPHIKLAYWAGGNPFHHHQDLNRLREAFSRLDTLIVNEIAWTATARHADIVFPSTMTLEREDIGGTPTDPLLVAMHRVVPPSVQARDDYDIFAALAERLGRREAFTEGRDARGWLRHLYDRTRAQLLEQGHEAPDFDTFWSQGEWRLPQQADDGGVLRAFRADPKQHPLKTPSGKIQICSPRIASFGYADCPGHPAWLTPVDAPSARHPLQLVANQPSTRLHSQFDFGAHSAAAKRREREVCRLHPEDAASRGIASGDIVRLFNDRGACLACAEVTPDVMVGVVQLPTGAWYDPVDVSQAQPLCVHGNPNVLTLDIGTSSLAQGCSGQLAAVQIERFDGALPPIRAFDPPVPRTVA